MKHYRSVELLSKLNVKPPYTNANPARINVKSPYWRLLRPESICDLSTTSSENQSAIDLVIKDASLALKG